MSKISAYSELGATPDTLDEFVIVDKSDTSMSASGTTKKVQAQYLTIADASTTVKGKVELLTDAETITGADTTRAMTASNLTAKMDTDGTLAGNSDTRIPSQKAVKTYADTKTTLDAVLSTIASGFTSISATLTFSSADAPTYVCTTSTDLTGIIGVGYRIKLTHSASTKFFIVTAIDASSITLYGGTDYTLAATAITAPYYSNVKAPLGFPLDPLKWQVNATDSTERSQVPVAGTWYNLGSLSITVPIGCWHLSYDSDVYINEPSGGSVQASLSTANNSESDGDMTCQAYVSAADGLSTHMHKSKYVNLSTKTIHYLIEKTAQASVDSIRINLSAGGETTTSILRAVCAYL